MLAIKGTYNQGKIDLEHIPPTNKSNVIVVFTDVIEPLKDNKKLNDDEQARFLFDKFTGSVERVIDYKSERLEAIDKKYESAN